MDRPSGCTLIEYCELWSILDGNKIKRSIFFEDTARNLKPANELGVSTVWIDNDFNLEEAKTFHQYIDFIGSDIKTILNDMTEN